MCGYLTETMNKQDEVAYMSKLAGVELELTQAESVSLELGLIKGLTKINLSCAGVNLTNEARFNSG